MRLLTHHRALPVPIPERNDAEIVQADLAIPTTLQPACKDIDCIVYVAGVLFRPRPEKFLRQTNTVYVQNLVDAALAKGVRKFLLVSFPHIEENSTPDRPATGTLDARPRSIHARTRLDPAPLTRDIVRMGTTSVVAETRRMKDALLPRLACPTLHDGLELL